MATYYRGARLHPADTKFIVHPHYATQAEASNEAINHQVRLTKFQFSSRSTFFCFSLLLQLQTKFFFVRSTAKYRSFEHCHRPFLEMGVTKFSSQLNFSGNYLN